MRFEKTNVTVVTRDGDRFLEARITFDLLPTDVTNDEARMCFGRDFIVPFIAPIFCPDDEDRLTVRLEDGAIVVSLETTEQPPEEAEEDMICLAELLDELLSTEGVA